MTFGKNNSQPEDRLTDERSTESRGAKLLYSINDWFARFIAVTDTDDLKILALWVAHTYLAKELYTTPRLQIDSVIFGSGKTTVLNHLHALCHAPIHAANLSSSALIPRMLADRMRTILLDEADRSLHPGKQGVEELLGILNSGYRFGAVRPVLVGGGAEGWTPREMSTYAPVAMAGNSPRLPDDTRSRAIRILLLPDLGGTVEDSDWEHIEDQASQLQSDIAEWTDSVRAQVKGMRVALPNRCIGRSKEKWRPLKRIAVAAGGAWPEIADRLIEKSLTEDDAEVSAGIRARPAGMILLADLHAAWPEAESFVPTGELIARVLRLNSSYWGVASPFGKQLSEQRFGQLLSRSAKVTSVRPGGGGTPRGYRRAQFEPIWRRLGIDRAQTGQTGQSGQSGPLADSSDRFNRLQEGNEL